MTHGGCSGAPLTPSLETQIKDEDGEWEEDVGIVEGNAHVPA